MSRLGRHPAAAEDELLGSFELAVQYPEFVRTQIDGEPEMQDERLAHSSYVGALLNQGLVPVAGDPTPNLTAWVQDPRTAALFGVHVDGNAIEASTPPLRRQDMAAVYAPFFQASSRLGWFHTAGAGHLHLDTRPFKRQSRRFVNFLIWFHNMPLSERIFQPVEGESTLFQRGYQAAFLHAVAEFRKIAEPTWLDVVRLFEPLYNQHLGSSMDFHDDTIELRGIGNQKSPEAAELEMKFYERLWAISDPDRLEEPIQWSAEAYMAELAPDEGVVSRLNDLLDLLSLDHHEYSNWVNDYSKTRRRGWERASLSLAESAHYRFDLQGYLADPKALMASNGVLKLIEWWKVPHLKNAVLKHCREVGRYSGAFEQFDWWEDPQVRPRILRWLQNEEVGVDFVMLLSRMKWWESEDVFKIVKKKLDGADMRAWELLGRASWKKVASLRETVFRALSPSRRGSDGLALDALSQSDWWTDSEVREALIRYLQGEWINTPMALKAVSKMDWLSDPRIKSWYLKVLSRTDSPTLLAALAELSEEQLERDPKLLEVVSVIADANKGAVERAARELIRVQRQRKSAPQFPDSYFHYVAKHGLRAPVVPLRAGRTESCEELFSSELP